MNVEALGMGNREWGIGNGGLVPFASYRGNEQEVIAAGSESGFEQLLEQAQNDSSSPSPKSQVPSPQIDRQSKLYEQCEALETFLIKNLIKSMRSTVQKTKLIDPGFAGEVYEDMLYDEYAKDFTKNARLGFAEMAYLELTGQRGKGLAKNFR